MNQEKSILQIKIDYFNNEIQLLKKTLEPGLRKMQKMRQSKTLEDAADCVIETVNRFISIRDKLVEEYKNLNRVKVKKQPQAVLKEI